MVWSTIVLSALPDTLALMPENALEGATHTNDRWVASATGIFTDAAVNDTAFPISAVYDRFLSVDSRPTGTGTAWSLVLRTASTKPIDVVCIKHNFGSIAGGVNCRLETADNDAFTLNLATIHDFGLVTSTKRLVRYLTSQWQGVERVRLVLTGSPAFSPRVSELFLSRRHTTKRKPAMPFDDASKISDIVIETSRGGVIATYENYAGARKWDIVYNTSDDTDISAIRNTFQRDGYAALPFLFGFKPVTNPTAAYWVQWMNPELTFPRTRAKERSVSIVLRESAPFYDEE